MAVDARSAAPKNLVVDSAYVKGRWDYPNGLFRNRRPPEDLTSTQCNRTKGACDLVVKTSASPTEPEAQITMQSPYQRIREAMLAGKPVSLYYKGHTRLVCAHALGTKNGMPQVLTFQYGGGSSSGLPNGGEWRCLMVGNISDVEIIEGQWMSDDGHNRAQTCVDQIDVEVWVDEAGKPYVKRA